MNANLISSAASGIHHHSHNSSFVGNVSGGGTSIHNPNQSFSHMRKKSATNSSNKALLTQNYVSAGQSQMNGFHI
jgi:hypothetical protein